jgi:MFS transporter, putative metabolite:H+ symporter
VSKFTDSDRNCLFSAGASAIARDKGASVTASTAPKGIERNALLIVLIAALGYFVDIYDLILFSIVRVQSLQDLGFTDDDLTSKGILLLNLQMAGMLVGGIFFGVIGDRRGRLKVLFGSILMYSLANLANAFVQSIEGYAVLRFLAGFGLAGELGVGITLVAEVLPKDKRGLGTSFVAAVGISGALLAWTISEKFDWRTAYIIGGVMGLALLFLRVGVFESALFKNLQSHGAQLKRGDFFALFRSRERFIRYLGCICVGVPLWYTVGLLMTLAPEFARALNVLGEVKSGKAIFYNYAGLVIGDVCSGLLSQVLKSRKKSILSFVLIWSVFVAGYFFWPSMTAEQFYGLSFVLGIFCGYWAMFVTVAAEQFGTNLRATVATTTPNFVRGSVVALTGLLTVLKPIIGLWGAGLVCGVASFAVALWGYAQLKESFHADLDFHETI